MSRSLKWSLVLGFVLVFIAGLAVGGYYGTTYSRHRGPDAAHHQLLAERLRNRMQARLNLTPEQMKNTAPIFEKAARELEQVRTDTAQRVHKIMTAADHDLSPALTAEQRAKLEALEAFHRRKMLSHNSHVP
jgi:Spy/CpxP family protein refolding chaperone